MPGERAVRAEEHRPEEREVLRLALALDGVEDREPAGKIGQARDRGGDDLVRAGDDRAVEAAEVVGLHLAERGVELVQERLRGRVGVGGVVPIQRGGRRLGVDVLRHGLARQRLQVQRERVDVRLVREVLAHQIRGRVQVDEHPVHGREMLHLLDRDAEQVGRDAEGARAPQADVLRLERVRGVQVLHQQRVLDLRRLPQ